MMDAEARLTGDIGVILKLQRSARLGAPRLKASMNGQGLVKASFEAHQMSRDYTLNIGDADMQHTNRLAHELPGTTSATDQSVLVTYVTGNAQEPLEKIVPLGEPLDRFMDQMHLFYLEGRFYLDVGRHARSMGERTMAQELFQAGIERFNFTRRPDHLMPVPDVSEQWRRDSLEEERLVSLGSSLDMLITLYEEQTRVKAERIFELDKDQ